MGFNERLHDYHPINVRHILIQPEESELSSDDEGYEADVEAKDAEAKQKARGSAGPVAGPVRPPRSPSPSWPRRILPTPMPNRVVSMKMSPVVPWSPSSTTGASILPARAGDTGIVKTTYGYHIMYFVGTASETFWELQVTDALKSEDMATWSEEKTEGYTAEQSSFGMQFVG